MRDKHHITEEPCEGKLSRTVLETSGSREGLAEFNTIAIVSDTEAHLKEFCSELEFDARTIRRLQRKMDRSRRASNPDNFNPNGSVKKGKKTWNSSKSYLKVRNSKANLERKLAAHRSSLHGELVNDILRTGDSINLEKLSYKAFQTLFGKSVGKRAPGMFVSHLKSKAQRAGGKVVEIPTYNTKLSQTCQCGRVKRKSLSERVHQCGCGVVAQRDLYSALLAKHTQPDTFVLQVSQLINDWQSAELRRVGGLENSNGNSTCNWKDSSFLLWSLPRGRAGRYRSSDEYV